MKVTFSDKINNLKYAISAGHEVTLEVAEDVLKNGGNAYDAAVAAFFTAFIAEPCMASAGCGGFATIGQKNKDVIIYDFFCQTPKIKRREIELDFYPVIVDFGEMKEAFHVGMGSIAVPGAIAGAYAIHEDLGSIPMTNLMEYAIYHAKNGVAINTFQALDLDLLKDIFKIDHRSKEVFFKNNEVLQEGDILKLDKLADFLDHISREGKEAFYKGEIAQSIVHDMEHRKGMLTMDDFGSYKVKRRSPLVTQFKNQTINTTPFPSLGGALMSIYLHYFEEHEVNSSLRRKAIPGILCDQLLKHPENIGQLLKEVRPMEGERFHQAYQNDAMHKGGTSHLNIVDYLGNSIAMTFTLGEGSGYFVKDTDMQLNNMLGESALMPDGFHSWPENRRLMSMMCPTIVHTSSNDKIILGSGGASRIPYAMGQVLDHIENGKSLKTAIDLPRVHSEHSVIHHEPNEAWINEAKNELITADYTIKPWNKTSLFFGGVHAIRVGADKTEAVGDFRRWGVSKVVY